jgi:hypothetical protein
MYDEFDLLFDMMIDNNQEENLRQDYLDFLKQIEKDEKKRKEEEEKNDE